MPESQWLSNYTAINDRDAITFYYPDNTVVLDFPYAVWAGDETTDDERAAAEQFGEFLMSDAQQNAAGQSGLRPANGGNLTQYQPFSEAVEAGAISDLNVRFNEIAAPNRAAAFTLLQWFKNVAV